MKEPFVWAARDANGELYIHPIKPEKFMQFWHSLHSISLGCIRLPDDSLPEVKWSDKEATKVKITIERCK